MKTNPIFLIAILLVWMLILSADAESNSDPIVTPVMGEIQDRPTVEYGSMMLQFKDGSIDYGNGIIIHNGGVDVIYSFDSDVAPDPHDQLDNIFETPQ